MGVEGGDGAAGRGRLTADGSPCTIHSQIVRDPDRRFKPTPPESRARTAPTMAMHALPVLTFDDLAVGDEWESPSRTVTEADVVAFAGLSGDFNPIHVDHHAASLGAFGRPVAHGLLGLAISSGLTSQTPRVATLAFLAILEWNFVRPIAFGDTIHVLTRVEAIEPKSRGRRAEVTWRRTLVNQDGATVQEGRSRTLVRGKSASGDEAAADPRP